MKIFFVPQIKDWDNYTISHEPIKSIDLMERAAKACFHWISEKTDKKDSIKIFCGSGNNGGDGLAIARLLSKNNFKVSVYIFKKNTTGSPDFETNLKRLKKTAIEINIIENKKSFPVLSKEDVIIDALFGTGLNKEVTGVIADLIEFINNNQSKVISIDIPSGLFVDKSSLQNCIIKATDTLTFQNQKLAFLMPENQVYCGKVTLLDIGLSEQFEKKEKAIFEWIDTKIIKSLYAPRNDFSNKGTLGYACLLAGSYGMMGAAILSSRACLRSGVGKLTTYICEGGYTIFQTCVPEAMCKVFGKKFIKDAKDFADFDVVGIGPGMGKHSSHKELLKNIFENFKKPVVIDADALNVLSQAKTLYKSIPANSIITPHPKEFERLFGKTNSDFEQMNLALEKAKELKIFIVLKGHYTFIATPEGKGYFNSTGNSGMATAGAGDVLTGIITALVAQKYSPVNACILGVYLHGLAGDIAAKIMSKESLIADDIIQNLGNAFKKIENLHFNNTTDIPV